MAASCESADVKVLNPRTRVPIGFIIDDSTCLVNLNRFAAPQFAAALGADSYHAKLPWRDWPVEIPDTFVRKFGEWCATNGVKGKYSIVPFPACVGRLDRELPGWTRREVEASIELVRTLIVPNFDIHPEMVTHTRVIDTRTGHPYPENSADFMENWGWTTGRSVDEIADYMTYGLRILQNIGLCCEGITTPGGFGNQARPQLAAAAFEAVRDVYGADIPHYFRDIHTEGTNSVAPIVQNVSGLDGPDPRCVVHVQGCTGDWTGGWDCSEPEGADKFITEDLQCGRMVEVIERGEPALVLAHWTGIYFNGQETGFHIFQEVVRRLHARFDSLLWMTLSEVARYWAAKELTRIAGQGRTVEFYAPFACPDFTVQITGPIQGALVLTYQEQATSLREVSSPWQLESGTWCRNNEGITVCFPLSKGHTSLDFAAG
jgi:hypothetical protein